MMCHPSLVPRLRGNEASVIQALWCLLLLVHCGALSLEHATMPASTAPSDEPSDQMNSALNEMLTFPCNIERFKILG